MGIQDSPVLQRQGSEGQLPVHEAWLSYFCELVHTLCVVHVDCCQVSTPTVLLSLTLSIRKCV